MTSTQDPAGASATLSSADVKKLRSYIKDETDGAALYRRLADAEANPDLAEVYRKLAATEDRHRHFWEQKLQAAGVSVPKYSPSFRTRVLGWVARRFGTNLVAPLASQMESKAYGMYDQQPEAVAAGLPRDERSHARVFREISRAGITGVDIASVEGRHSGASGNAIRAAVLGANDGLVSNLSLVMGVAGADPGGNIVLVTGVAGLLAGALSMALGEWISVQNSAEYFQRQIQIERDELAEMPEEEKEELVLIYRSRGLDQATAQEMADRAFDDHHLALQTLAREELGLGGDEGGNPWTAAIVSFLTFSFGAIMPVIPWLFVEGFVGIAGSLVLSGLGLVLVGLATTFFTGRGAWFSAGRMLLFGLTAAAITFGIGSLLGVSVEG